MCNPEKEKNARPIGLIAEKEMNIILKKDAHIIMIAPFSSRF
jgi:hypothetical protein